MTFSLDLLKDKVKKVIEIKKLVKEEANRL
jgi:hypothetical protein